VAVACVFTGTTAGLSSSMAFVPIDAAVAVMAAGRMGSSGRYFPTGYAFVLEDAGKLA